MILYTDLDGTMLGPRGCFFRSRDHTITLAPAEALAAWLQAGHDLVLVSGRTSAQLVEASLLFGAEGYIGELGSIVSWGHCAARAELPGAGPPADEALVAKLLADFPGRLEFHEPWHLGHEVDVMLRGNVPGPQARAWLDVHDAKHLELRDNGVLPPGRPTGLDPALLPVHVYHLIPRGISKGTAVAWDLRRRGLSAADAIGIGDSRSDLEMAEELGSFFLVANGAAHIGSELAANVTVTGESQGLGWAQAIRATLGRR